jgi:hypothetical protein
MDARARVLLAEAHFNDLQADIEAAARQLEAIQTAAWRVRDTLAARRISQAAMGSLMKQIVRLRKTMTEQRTIMRQLRHDIRRFRGRYPSRSQRLPVKSRLGPGGTSPAPDSRER